jgi:hypothetical protein
MLFRFDSVEGNNVGGFAQAYECATPRTKGL